ncbi:hypothetical protein D3C73_1290960 [compost metagenome]
MQRHLHHPFETVGDPHRHDPHRQAVADEALDQFHQVDLETHLMRQARCGERIIGLPARAGTPREIDQGLILQRRQRQSLARGQPMLRRQHGHQILFLQHLVADAFKIGRRCQPHQRHVQCT